MKPIRILLTVIELGILAILILWVYHSLFHEKFHILSPEQVDNIEIIAVGTIISVVVERLMGKVINLFGRKE